MKYDKIQFSEAKLYKQELVYAVMGWHFKPTQICIYSGERHNSYENRITPLIKMKCMIDKTVILNEIPIETPVVTIACPFPSIEKYGSMTFIYENFSEPISVWTEAWGRVLGK